MSGLITLLTALGWSLLNSIWQLAVLWILYVLITAGNNRMSAAGKHNLALVCIAAGSGWMAVSFIELLNHPSSNIISGFIPVSQKFNQWIPLISTSYLGILGIRSVRYGCEFFRTRNRGAQRSVSSVLQEFTERQRKILRITKRVEIFISEKAGTAETSGIFKSLILLPASVVTRLSVVHLEAIIVHELIHIRRNDYLVNIALFSFRTVLFFNPFAILFYQAVCREREHACDDEVIEKGYAPTLYAEALYSLEKQRHIHSGFALAADGKQPWLLMERIRRVLGYPSTPVYPVKPILLFSLILSLGLISLEQDISAPQVSLPGKFPELPSTTFTNYNPVSLPVKRSPAPKAKIVRSCPKIVRNKIVVPQTREIPEISAYTDASEPVANMVFADNRILRNYSNQQIAEPNTDLIMPVPGTPYVPSASLSFEELSGPSHSDSLIEWVIQERLKEIAVTARVQAKRELNKLETDLTKNRQLLRNLEQKNRQLIRQREKNIQSQLDKIRIQIDTKKQAEEQLRIRISDEEIIHM